MPWTDKQQAVARAVAHGWKPTGSAKGFDRSFAEQVIAESKPKRRRRGTLQDLGSMKIDRSR